MESKEVKEIFKTIKSIYVIVKLKIPVYYMKGCFYIKCKSEGKVGLELQTFYVKKWSLVFRDKCSLNTG